MTGNFGDNKSGGDSFEVLILRKEGSKTGKQRCLYEVNRKDFPVIVGFRKRHDGPTPEHKDYLPEAEARVALRVRLCIGEQQGTVNRIRGTLERFECHERVKSINRTEE